MKNSAVGRTDMLTRSVSYLLVKLSVPPMAGMLIMSVFGLADTFFVARLGSDALAALTLVIPVQVLITSMASATGVGITSLIGRTLGRGERAYADNAAWHGVILAIVYGFLFIGLGMKYMDEILLFFGCETQIFVLSKGYMRIILAGCFFTFVPIILTSVIQGEGNTFLPVLISAVSMGLNVALDPVFIFGMGPISGMGLNGAAVAGVIAQGVSSLLVVGLVTKKKRFLSWSVRNFHPSFKVLIDIYRVGIPTLIMELTGVLIMGYLNRLLAGYSFTAVAALGIFLRIRSMMYMPVFGLIQGTMPIAAFAFGAGNYNRVKEILVKAAAASFLFMAAAWVIMQVYPMWIIQYFSREPALTLLGVNCMRTAALFIPLIGPVLILSTVLQAAGKGMEAMSLSLCRQIGFFLPLLIILPRYYSLNGIWMAFSISELLAACLALGFLLRLWRELQAPRVPFFLLFGWRYAAGRFLTWLKWRQ